MKNLLEFIEANGGDPGKFVDWFTSEENLMEAGPAPSSNPAPLLTAGGSWLGQKIGQFVGRAGGIGSGMARGLAQTIGGTASGIAQGAKAGYRAITADLPSSAKNATDALKNLENRISQSAELKAMFKDPNFIPLLQNLQKTIATALVENRKSRSVINEAQKKSEYKKVFIELTKAGIDPHEALKIYVENNLYMNEIFQSIVNWFANIGTRWKERLRNISNKQDQDAIANAMTALGKLQQDIPAFGQKPSQEFQKFAQELAIAVNNATGGAHGAEAYKEITSDLKNRLKSTLNRVDQAKIDQFDPNALVNIVVKSFDEYKKRSPILNRDDQQLEWITFVAKEIIKNPSNVENVQSMINGFNSEKFFLVDLLKNQGARSYTEVKNKLSGIADQNARFLLSSNLLQYAAKYADAVKNDPEKVKQWYKGIVEKIDEIIKNPNNLERVQGVMSGYVSEKEFYDNMAKNGVDSLYITSLKPILDALGTKKIPLITVLMQHAKKYAGLVKNDPSKMRLWYMQIGSQIKSDVNKARQKAIELETKAAGGPAATKAKAYMDAVTGPAASKYDIIMDEEKDDFERQFQATYMAVGDNPDSGKQILQKTIELFSPQQNTKGSVNLFAQAYEKALAEKIREWYDGVSGNNFASELQPILKTPTDQLKLVQKFNQALKAGTGKEEFWQDIGYKLRNNENIFESRKPKVDQQFLDSILGKTKNPQASWFNF